MITKETLNPVLYSIALGLFKAKQTMRTCAGRHDDHGQIDFKKSRPGYTVKSDGKALDVDKKAHAFIKAVDTLVANKAISLTELSAHEKFVTDEIAAARAAASKPQEAPLAEEAPAKQEIPANAGE